MLADQAVTLARKLWSEGHQRIEIARRTGLPVKRVSTVCAVLPKPIDHRGRRRPGWAAGFHVEDLEAE